MQHFDFLVIGTGIAGLSYALDAAADGTVAVLTKKNAAESNTNYAQGGIAAVTSAHDSFDLHVRDTLIAGDGLCRDDVVRAIVQHGPDRIDALVKLGMEFCEREETGPNGKRQFDLGKEGGHSKRRVLHAKDVTGREIEKALLAAVHANPRIQLFEDHLAIDLITTAKLGWSGRDRCLGVYAFDKRQDRVEIFAATVTLLATGGCGKVYLFTTNPDIATGDGIAMAHRAGVPVANMEFIQFHPTCLFHPLERSFLISEAVRGEGARLVDRAGEEFMPRYDARRELAPRDIVARSIDAEMKRTGADCVFLDLTHKGAAFIQDRFPNIHQTCLRLGIDITTQPIPVVPAAHYQCGGIVAAIDGSTALLGLLCAGEVACTGLHGANRLASNSLLEALVMAHVGAARARALRRDLPPVPADAIPAWQSGNVSTPDELVVVSHNWDEIRRLMWDYVGIVRTTRRLQRAWSRLQNLEREVREFYWNFRVTSDLLELRNLVVIAQLIVASALARHESRGLHFTLDYPDKDPAPADTVVHRTESGPRAQIVPLPGGPDRS